jgi:hypothetical protein
MLTIDGKSGGGGGVHLRSRDVLCEFRGYERPARLGALDGEAGAGEAAGAAVERSPARLHPRRDHVEVVGGRKNRGPECGEWNGGG